MFDDPSGAGVASSLRRRQGSPRPSGPGFVVAIPVRDEEERLPACLRALARQRDRLGQPIPPTLVRVVVFANNCSDRSASLARKLGAGLSLDVRVVEARLPPADRARRLRPSRGDGPCRGLAGGSRREGRRDPDHRR